MESGFVVQRRDGPGSTWTTVTGDSTRDAATCYADEVRQVLGGIPHLPALPVRVISVDELAKQERLSQNAAKMLQRWPPKA